MEKGIESRSRKQESRIKKSDFTEAHRERAIYHREHREELQPLSPFKNVRG